MKLDVRVMLAMSVGALVSLSRYDGSGAGSAHSALCSVSSITAGSAHSVEVVEVAAV